MESMVHSALADSELGGADQEVRLAVQGRTGFI